MPTVLKHFRPKARTYRPGSVAVAKKTPFAR
jgi:hypothetical protein